MTLNIIFRRLAMSRKACPALLLLSVLVASFPVAGYDATMSAVASQMEINRERYGIAGQAVYVARGRDVLFRGVDGDADRGTHAPMTLDHAFPVYSLSKLLASTLVMQLSERGDVDLQAPAGNYVRGLPAQWQDIPVRNFLNHTSGVPEYLYAKQYKTTSGDVEYPQDLKTLFASLADTPLQFPSGGETRYTQTNYLVLSALLSEHYGKPYTQIAEERILQPLGMTSSWFGPDKPPGTPIVISYLGSDGSLREENALNLPAYAYAHGSLHVTLHDLARFLQALESGKLVSKRTLLTFWRESVLSDGRRGIFVSGWEYGERGSIRHVGHDGGTKVRVRIVLSSNADDTSYLVAYLTNGSARNVWSSILVDSVLAAVAPKRFPILRLQEDLFAYATRPTNTDDVLPQISRIRASISLDDQTLERTVNTAGYMLLANVGADAALRVFILNTTMFPDSANTWDSLGEAYSKMGAHAEAEAAYEMSRQVVEKRED